MQFSRLPSVQVSSTDTATPADSINTIKWDNVSSDNDWGSPRWLQVCCIPPYDPLHTTCNFHVFQVCRWRHSMSWRLLAIKKTSAIVICRAPMIIGTNLPGSAELSFTPQFRLQSPSRCLVVMRNLSTHCGKCQQRFLRWTNEFVMV